MRDGLEGATCATGDDVIQEELQECRAQWCNQNTPDEGLITCFLEFLLQVDATHDWCQDGRAEGDDATDEWAAELDEREDVLDGLRETRLTERRPNLLGEHRLREYDDSEEGDDE